MDKALWKKFVDSVDACRLAAWNVRADIGVDACYPFIQFAASLNKATELFYQAMRRFD